MSSVNYPSDTGVYHNIDKSLQEKQRVVIYHQTDSSLLPLVTLPRAARKPKSVTHINIAAFHILDTPGDIHLNNVPPDDSYYEQLWKTVSGLQQFGVKVLGMLGGAAQGSYKHLDDDEKFEDYYGPLRDMIKKFALDGMDLDVEENMSLNGIERLVNRLNSDFGDDFIITLAPVASALSDGANLSGFSYSDLEKDCGDKINWYNTQFYSGFGSMDNKDDYVNIVNNGWPPSKVIAGVLTNQDNGSGYVDLDDLKNTLKELTKSYDDFGGVAGWEYFNSVPGGKSRPWEWALVMQQTIDGQSD